MARMEIEGMRLKLAEDGTLLLADAEQEMGARPCAAGLLRGGYAIGTDSSTSIAIGRARAAGGVHGSLEVGIAGPRPLDPRDSVR